ncbi:hypothetical protein [Nocardia xishanensis]|uniref:Uncharacterized protein n=1 Tax=Nocardia xishanensis TaxID=238964 RepID=A0ABW7X9Z5_9NOCA
MNTGGRICRTCRTALPARHAGNLCPDCASAAGFKHALTADFFDDPTIRAALADHDFSVVFTKLDLVNGLPDHFHQPQHERERFAAAYGYDLLDWPGWTLLRDITELHSLGAYIRLAPTKPAAAEELRQRIRSLRIGDKAAIWQAVS